MKKKSENKFNQKHVLITGGSGFIGINLALSLLNSGYLVTIFDNFSRFGTKGNINWLKKNNHNLNNLKIVKGDIRDYKKLKKEVLPANIIFHLAAQVAVTSSFTNPKEDFEINVLGSLNVLEAAKESKKKPIIIYSSTNKVYGDLAKFSVRKNKKRYFYPDIPNGVSEEVNLDFHSPYGCSKGSADQYFRDFYRMYGLRTVVFRQSCIYGLRQMGIVDQGWVAFLAALVHLKKPITIFGDGKQVRDLLHVDDLIRAYMQAIKNIKKSAGEIYNIGGGKNHTFSLLEYIEFLEKAANRKIPLKYKDWRPGDQKVYISDNKKLKQHLKWEPKICHKDGLKELYKWVGENKDLFK